MKIIFTLMLVSSCQFCFGQEILDVTEQTIKIGSKEEEILYYGFAEGDQIIFNFEEINEKEVKEVEIIEFPENSKFKDYEVKSVKDKKIRVNKRAVYKFRFYNSAMMKGRVCKIKIQRIPKSPETMNFNTSIKWIEKYDTTYEIKNETVTIGHDTINKQKSKKVLVSTDTSIVTVTDRVERVHSISNANGNVSMVTFQLPENSYSPNIFKPYKSTETISWAYSLATGESGKAWYKDSNRKAAARKTANLATKAGLLTGGYGALALLAIEGVSAFANPPKGDNIQFGVYKGQNVMAAHYGNSVAVSGRVTDSKQGYHTIRLENDNVMDGINVDVKVIAVLVTKTWKDEDYTVQEIEPIKEKKILKIPKVAKINTPVTVED